MAWAIEFSERAQRALRKLDRAVAQRIVVTLARDLARHGDPRAFGKALHGELGGYWRYRIGDHRVIVRIDDTTVTVLVLELGHRREVYR